MTNRSAPFTAPPFLVRVASPIGRLELTSDGEAVTSLSIERAGSLPLEQYPEHGNAVLETAKTQLAEYFAGTRHDFDLPVKAAGTDFQKSVWKEISALGWGEVASYGDVGIATGRPTAGRAVGGAVGANPIPIIVPCHRILAGNGKITGYSGGNGIPTKAWLLDHEGIVHRTVIATGMEPGLPDSGIPDSGIPDSVAAELEMQA
ncbi:MAG: methylated-DNA--[protein]-cysteine S-methyltransferase [Microterricola sp.]